MKQRGVLVLLFLLFVSPAWAGPVLIGGDDADDHGSVLGGANQTGWLYIQKGFENLLPAVGNGQTRAVCLGCNSSQALAGFQSGFDLATKPAGWTRHVITTATGITQFFAGTHASLTTPANTGLLYVPTDAANVGGGITAAELAVLNANAANINTFVGGAGTPKSGGGLFAHDESSVAGGWGWLTTLIPGIVVNTCFLGTVRCTDSDLTITSAGITAFPGLTDADVDNATPWHSFFTGSLGGLSILVTGPGSPTTTGTLSQQPVILGGGAGTVIGCGAPGQPACPGNNVPEPSTLLLLGGAASVASVVGRIRARRRRK